MLLVVTYYSRVLCINRAFGIAGLLTESDSVGGRGVGGDSHGGGGGGVWLRGGKKRKT